jgi:hypothetical protein
MAMGLGLLGIGVIVGVLSGRSEEGIRGFIAGPLFFALIMVPLLRVVRRHPERGHLLRIVYGGMFLRLLFAVAHLLVGFVVYGGAIDFVGYHDLAGTFIDSFLSPADPLAPPEEASLDRGSVANFVTIVVLAVLRIVVGPQFIGLFLVTAAAGTVAAWLFYRAFEIRFPDARGRRFYAAILFLLPSVGFWSIFLGKDVVVFLCLAVATYAVARLVDGLSSRAVLLLAAALLGLFLIRAPVGIGVAVAALCTVILRPLRWHGPEAWLRPVQRAVVAIAIVVGFYPLATGVLLRMGVQEITLEALAERAAMQHQGFAATAGGTQMESMLVATDPVSVALFLPYGIMTLLFRPFLWEAHNALALVAGVENLFFMGLCVWRAPAIMRSLRTAVRSPFLVFTVVAFVMTTVALSFQWNLGATARLRTMALPFLLLLMADPTPERQS